MSPSNLRYYTTTNLYVRIDSILLSGRWKLRDCYRLGMWFECLENTNRILVGKHPYWWAG